MTRYWYQSCPVCRQGRLFAEIRKDTGQPMLECEECSRAWDSPAAVSTDDGAFMAISIDSRFATRSDIAALPDWASVDFHEVS